MGGGWVLGITLLTAASLLMGIANTVWTWMSKGGARLASKQREQDLSISEHDVRLVKIESFLPHLPTKDELTALQLGMERVTTRLEGFNDDVRRLDRTVDRFERALTTKD